MIKSIEPLDGLHTWDYLHEDYEKWAISFKTIKRYTQRYKRRDIERYGSMYEEQARASTCPYNEVK